MTSHGTDIPRVTFCINELDVGGAEKAMVRIAIGLSQSGWNVRVISLRDAGPLAADLQTADVPVTALECGGFADVRTFWRLRQELKVNPPDVLSCFLHQANIYGRLAAKFSGGPMVISGIRVADRRKWVVLTDRISRCCTTHYIAVSQQVADTHARLCGISADRICAIPNGVDCPDPQCLPAVGTRPGKTLLFVGRLTEQKDPMCLLSAFLKLPESLKASTQLTFVGDGPLRAALGERIQQEGLEERVRLAGHRADVVEMMRESTVLVLPSRWEGLPNVVLEAMANGLPVVASHVDGVGELISDGQTGWLVPPGDPIALAETLAAVLADKNRRGALLKIGANTCSEVVYVERSDLRIRPGAAIIAVRKARRKRGELTEFENRRNRQSLYATTTCARSARAMSRSWCGVGLTDSARWLDCR